MRPTVSLSLAAAKVREVAKVEAAAAAATPVEASCKKVRRSVETDMIGSPIGDGSRISSCRASLWYLTAGGEWEVMAHPPALRRAVQPSVCRRVALEVMG